MNNNERLYKISEIADIAKVNKTKVWRYIRDNNISERSMKGNAKLYSEHTKDVIITLQLKRKQIRHEYCLNK